MDTASERSEPSVVLILAESRPTRFAMFFLLYFCQGIPLGLSMVAIPAWLAAAGQSTAAIGAVVSTAFLPWGIKMFNGLLMDRYAFLPMGRRRAWLIGAQGLIFLTLIAFIVIAPGQDDLALITALLFTMNVGATFQDVAIDGIAVDVTPQAERGRVNGVMAAGQIIGISGIGALGGLLLPIMGMQGAVLPGTIIIAASLIAVSMVLERAGERRLPWSAGKAAPHAADDSDLRWGPLLKAAFGAFLDKRLLALLVSMACYGGFAGILVLAVSVYSVGELGWASERASNLLSLSGLVAGVVGLVVFGAAIDKLSAMRVGIISFSALTVLWALFIQLDVTSGLFTGAVIATFLIIQASFIAINADAMRFCRPDIAASQFALFVAVPNIARVASTNVVDPLVNTGGYGLVWLTLACLPALGAACWLYVGRKPIANIPAPSQPPVG